eukprot:TRINITY_DN13141_c0_g1_i1.p1 TRINITY_DN13141_c0_g1~~TRINITY_DN13141_c0_g1_i1.p1  ORF type:complete len:200 (+),score=28.46 TRINITY_DN13141_c0_g1_i1:113-712(+)
MHNAKYVFDKAINWFPGHMAKATRQMAERLNSVDLVMEIRDARIPFSSGNPYLDTLIGTKPRLVVLNKADLANPDLEQHVVWRFREHKLRAVFVVASNQRQAAALVRTAVASLPNRPPAAARAAAADPLTEVAWDGDGSGPEYVSRMLVLGVPNVGKSTLLNLPTEQSAAAVTFTFCKIKPNEARCEVPDERYQWLCDI